MRASPLHASLLPPPPAASGTSARADGPPPGGPPCARSPRRRMSARAPLSPSAAASTPIPPAQAQPPSRARRRRRARRCPAAADPQRDGPAPSSRFATLPRAAQGLPLPPAGTCRASSERCVQITIVSVRTQSGVPTPHSMAGATYRFTRASQSCSCFSASTSARPSAFRLSPLRKTVEWPESPWAVAECLRFSNGRKCEPEPD